MIRTNDHVIAQARENIMALLRWHLLPDMEVAATLTDRVLFHRTREFVDAIEWQVKTGVFREWQFYRNHGATALRSWRETVLWASLQIVEHPELIEVDIDLCNPDGGALPALGHFVEWAWPGKTDPFRAWSWIRRRGIDVPLVKPAAGNLRLMQRSLHTSG